MAKKTERPSWFHSDDQFHDHVAALEREFEGRKNRLAELEALGAHPDVLEEVRGEIDAVKGQLWEHGAGGHRAASKRPAGKGETR